MITNEFEYQCALEELRTIETMLIEMLAEHRIYRPDLELLGVRRLAIRLHKELGDYESSYNRPLPLTTASVRTMSVAAEMNSMSVQEVAS